MSRIRLIIIACAIIAGMAFVLPRFHQPPVRANPARTPIPAFRAGSGQVAIATATPTMVGTGDPGDFATRVIARTNMYRQQHGCPLVVANAILMGTAQFHSEDMAVHDFVGHDSFDGTKSWDRMSQAGYHYQAVGENVAWGQQTPEQVVDVWYNEVPPNDAHRQNILNCTFRDIGVGYVYLANDPGAIQAHTYWTQDFGVTRNG